MVFPLDGGNGILVSSKNVRDLVELYAKWIALHLATIWVTTIILIDRDVQGAWKQTRIGTRLSKKPIPGICAGFLILILCGLWMAFFIIVFQF